MQTTAADARQHVALYPVLMLHQRFEQSLVDGSTLDSCSRTSYITRVVGVYNKPAREDRARPSEDLRSALTGVGEGGPPYSTTVAQFGYGTLAPALGIGEKGRHEWKAERTDAKLT